MKHKHNRQRPQQKRRSKKKPTPRRSTKAEKIPALMRLRPGANGDPILEIPAESIPILEALSAAMEDPRTRADLFNGRRAVISL